MASDAEAGDVCRTMAFVFIHELSSVFVQGTHRFNSHEVRLFSSVRGDVILSLVGPFVIVFNKPFIQVDSNLSS